MANDKAKKNNTGFSAPTYGEMLPNGAKIKKHKDGTCEIIYPNKKEKK